LSFNPRARAGRDLTLDTGIIANDVSIHAPARGATREKTKLADKLEVSIHAPARGATS